MWQTCNDLAGKFLTQQSSQAVLQLTSCFVAEGDDHHLPWFAPLLLYQIFHSRCKDACLSTARSSYNPAVKVNVLEMRHIFGVWVLSKSFMLPRSACAIAEQNMHGLAHAPDCWRWAGSSDVGGLVRWTGDASPSNWHTFVLITSSLLLSIQYNHYLR